MMKIICLLLVVFLIVYVVECLCKKPSKSIINITEQSEEKSDVQENYENNENYNYSLIEKVNDFKPNENSKELANLENTYKDFKNNDEKFLKDKLVNFKDEKYNVKDYLPNETNDEWFDTDFSQAKHNIKDGKLINTTTHLIGVDTVGQSLKNPSYDIRTTIPNPKMSISPWNNSTFEPDYNKKSLC